MTKEEIIKRCDEAGVKFIRLQFSDILGVAKNVAIPRSQLEKALDNDIMFDGSSIQGFTRIEESDMNLRPDLNTFALFPWRTGDAAVARLICDVYKTDGTPSRATPLRAQAGAQAGAGSRLYRERRSGVRVLPL